jgi:hypothetical protein
MNNLVKLLIEDLLNGDGKTVAIFGGGFKPPTAGHLEVVKNTLSQFPDINELIVFVGGGVRDGITQAESLDIWNIYKKHLPNNVKIETTVAPVKAVLDYAKNNPKDKVYWILGTREGNEEDVKDIIERTKSVGKYPNIEVKIINTDNSTSGTKARQALKANNKEEFLKYIPNIPEQEQIWNIVSPVIKETVTDTEVICDNCGWHWKIEDGGDDLYTCHKCGHDNNPDLNEGKQVGLLYHYTSTNGLKGILQSNRINASEENYLGNELYYISFTRDKNFHKKGSKFGVSTEYRITLDGDKLSNKYKIRPFAYIPGWDIKDSWELDWLDDEPESVRRDFFNATGDYDEQEERIFFKNENGGIDNIKNYILAVDKVEDLQEGRKKQPDPKVGTGKKPEGSGRRLYTDEDPKDTVHVKFKTKEDIVDTLNKESFKAKSHARQSQIINLIHQRVRAAYNKTKDPEVKSRLKRALDYIESRKEASKEKTERLRKMKEASDPQAGTALPYGSGFAPVKESYQFKVSDKVYDNEDNSLITVEYKFSTPDNTYRVEFYSGEYNPEAKTFDVSFGLDKYGSKLDTFQMTGEGNALNILKTIIDVIKDFTNRFEVNKLVINPTSEKREKIYSMILKSLPSDISNKVELIKENNEKTWDLKEGIVSLTKYMVDNGLNIKPLPKVKFISNDKENASNLLGKTAYYNPADKSITLYTMDRHPKDVLRSFSHEMIHHMQNLEGKLDNINTTNTNEGGDLPEMEREAYEKGNMMLRNWEDSIKSEKYLKEYKQYVLTELFEKDLSNIEKISPLEYIVGDGKDIEAKYYFRLDEPDSNKWSIHWNFTNNNKNTSPEAWKKITTTSFKVLKDFINTKNPTYISISGNENKSGKNAKLNIYKSKSFLEKLENIFNNQYLIKNDNEDFILMKSIEEAYKHSINESVRHGKEKYEDALYYWQNLDINSKSKIERWSAIKRKVKREVLQEVYNIKNV